MDLANVNLFPGQMINVPETTVEEMQDQKMIFLVRVDLNMGVGKIAQTVKVSGSTFNLI